MNAVRIGAESRAGAAPCSPQTRTRPSNAAVATQEPSGAHASACTVAGAPAASTWWCCRMSQGTLALLGALPAPCRCHSRAVESAAAVASTAVCALHATASTSPVWPCNAFPACSVGAVLSGAASLVGSGVTRSCATGYLRYVLSVESPLAVSWARSSWYWRPFCMSATKVPGSKRRSPDAALPASDSLPKIKAECWYPATRLGLLAGGRSG